MKLLINLALLLAALVSTATANTEKVIFLAPESVGLSGTSPGLEVLDLESLANDSLTLRTSLEVAFPSEEHPYGRDHWFTLRNLNEHQRYELRVCWTAIQPTKFWLDVYNISTVFDTPHLIQSLADFSEQPGRRRPGTDQLRERHTAEASESVLFLHLRAAADYFTSNETLMLQPPQVDIDLILDPYAWSIFPKSLGLTAGYILVTGFVAWFASGLCWEYLAATSMKKSHSD